MTTKKNQGIYKYEVLEIERKIGRTLHNITKYNYINKKHMPDSSITIWLQTSEEKYLIRY